MNNTHNLTDSQFKSLTRTAARVADEAARSQVHYLYAARIDQQEARIKALEDSLRDLTRAFAVESNTDRSVKVQQGSQIRELQDQSQAMNEEFGKRTQDMMNAAVVVTRRLERLEYQVADRPTRLENIAAPTMNHLYADARITPLLSRVKALEDGLAVTTNVISNEKNGARSAGAQFRAKLETLEEYVNKNSANLLSRMDVLILKTNNLDEATTYYGNRVQTLMAKEESRDEFKKERTAAAYGLSYHARGTLSLDESVFNGTLHSSSGDLIGPCKVDFTNTIHTQKCDPAGPNSNWFGDKWLIGDWGFNDADSNLLDSDAYRLRNSKNTVPPPSNPMMYGYRVRAQDFVREPTNPFGVLTDEFGMVKGMALNYRNGDRKVENGETFYFWWGQWRRESELKGFSNWVTKKAFKK